MPSAIVAVYSVEDSARDCLETFSRSLTKKIPEVVEGAIVTSSVVSDTKIVSVSAEAEQVVVRVPTQMSGSKKQRVMSVLKECMPIVYTPSVAFKGKLYEIA